MSLSLSLYYLSVCLFLSTYLFFTISLSVSFYPTISSLLFLCLFLSIHLTLLCPSSLSVFLSTYLFYTISLSISFYPPKRLYPSSLNTSFSPAFFLSIYVFSFFTLFIYTSLSSSHSLSLLRHAGFTISFAIFKVGSEENNPSQTVIKEVHIESQMF